MRAPSASLRVPVRMRTLCAEDWSLPILAVVTDGLSVVYWLCKVNNHPIEYKYTDSGKGETRTDTFLQLSPIGKIPVLKDGEFVLTER